MKELAPHRFSLYFCYKYEPGLVSTIAGIRKRADRRTHCHNVNIILLIK